MFVIGYCHDESTKSGRIVGRGSMFQGFHVLGGGLNGGKSGHDGRSRQRC